LSCFGVSWKSTAAGTSVITSFKATRAVGRVVVVDEVASAAVGKNTTASVPLVAVADPRIETWVFPVSHAKNK
jgi:hypothetical protein